MNRFYRRVNKRIDDFPFFFCFMANLVIAFLRDLTVSLSFESNWCQPMALERIYDVLPAYSPLFGGKFGGIG